MAAKPVPVTNVAAAKSGDRRQALEVLRDTLARALDECDPNMHAQIAGQYRATLADLAALSPSKAVSKRDELAARRRTRAGERTESPKPGGGSSGLSRSAAT